MLNITDELQSCQMFQNVPEEFILRFISDFPCQIKYYSHGDCIISKDETPQYIGIALSGTLGIYTDNYYGKPTLIGIADKNYLFGFIAHFYHSARSITTLYARNACKIARFIIPSKMAGSEFVAKTAACIISNIFAILTTHIEHDFTRMYLIGHYSIKVRLARYLLNEYDNHHALEFECPYNKTELASFLGVYRTSLNHEIKKMCDLNIISFDKKRFRIIALDKLLFIEQTS